MDGAWTTKEGTEVQAGEDGKPVGLLVVEEEEEEEEAGMSEGKKVEEEMKAGEQREGSRTVGLA